MDAWGYSFRLGSSANWFYNDADDALAWLMKYQLVMLDKQQKIQPTWNVRS